MDKDLFELLGQQPAAPAAVQDADAMSVAPLAAVPQGDAVFASDAEKTALLREQPYTRKGTMPERMVTRQQFIEDFLARGFTERTEFRRGSVMVTKFENVESGEYYILNRTFERAYANRRFDVLFPDRALGAKKVAGPARDGAPKKTENRVESGTPSSDTESGTGADEAGEIAAAAEGVHAEVLAATNDESAASAAAREVEEAVGRQVRTTQPGRQLGRKQLFRGVLEQAVRAARAKYTAGPKMTAPEAAFVSEMRRDGTGQFGDAEYVVAVSRSLDDVADAVASEPHWAVVVTRDGRKRAAADKLTLEAARARAISLALGDDRANELLIGFANAPSEPAAVYDGVEEFVRAIGLTGAAVRGEVSYRIVPAVNAPAATDAKQAHYAVEITRGGRREVLASELDLVAAQERAIEMAYPSLTTAPAREAKAPKSRPEPKPIELRPEERDFSYTPADDFTPRGRKTRIAANVAALKLLYQLEAEGRLATPAEKQVLARYCGWGADKACFDEQTAVAMEEWREHKRSMAQRYGAGSYYAQGEMPDQWKNWEKEYGSTYKELRELMTEPEWKHAAQSLLNAHYTDEPIAHRLWSIARRIGFKGGAVAEFGCGTGKVIGAMPAELRATSTVLGVERDAITARIAKLLFPQSQIEQSALQDLAIRPNSIDLVIGNVPFSDVEPSGQRGKVRFNLHNYFIARSIEALRPGGLAVLITSASTLEANDDQRAALADRAELLGAIRLPNDAFAANANTEVVTDVLVLRKPTVERRVASESFRASLAIQVKEAFRYDDGRGKIRDTAPLNEYFVRHPEMVLGEHSLNGKMYARAGQYTVESLPNMPELAERLDAAIGRLPENVPNSSLGKKQRHNTLLEEAEQSAEQLRANVNDKTGGIVVREGKVYVVTAERDLEQPDWYKADYKLPRGVASASAGDQLVKQWVSVRDALRTVIATDLNPMASEAESERARRSLLSAYRKFTEENGTITENKALRTLLRFEPEYGNVEALENVREIRDAAGKRQRIVEPAAILTTRTLRPTVTPSKADNILDAAMLSLGQHGRIDVDYICALIGKDDADTVKKLMAAEGVAFEDPQTGELEPRQRYLSGNVRAKLEAAEAAAAADARFAMNVQALKAVQPTRVPFDQIRWPIGATWIPSELVDGFARDTFGQGRDFQVRYFPRGCVWLVPPFAYSSKLAGWSAEGLKKTIEAETIFTNVLGQEPIRITYTEEMADGSKRTFLDEQGTANANERAEAMRRAWADWVNAREDAKALIEETYNNTFNNVVPPEADGRALTFPGLATGPGVHVPRPHQRNGVMRALLEQAGIVHYGVGFGKTLVGILASYEMKRMGGATKPMIVCDNSNYAQFVDAARRTYPQARILHSTDEDMKAENRERFKNRVATGDWDLVLMQRSHFERIPVSWQTEAKWISEELSDLRAVKLQIGGEDGKGATTYGKRGNAFARRIAKALESAEERLKDKLEQMKARTDQGLTWEELGVDFLVVDECHREKKTGFATRFDIKGIDSKASQRGRGLLMKVRHIQERRGGRGAVGMSGTVCTNTMAEFWAAQRTFNPNILEHYNVPRFDDFKTAFCQAEDALELNEANGRWRIVNRLSRFVNGPAFVQFIRAGMDVKMDSAEVQLNVPKLKGGAIELCSVPLTDAVFEKMDRLAKLYEEFENTSGAKKKELSWVPIMLMQCGMAASIDPRLVDRDAPDEDGSLVKKLIENVVGIYRERKEQRSTQCIFLDRYRTMDTSSLKRLESEGLGNVRIEIEDADNLPGIDEADADEAAEKQEVEAEAKPTDFNLYRDIKAKLIAAGVPAEEIAVVHDAKNADERKAMFSRVDAGEIRVILGSSDKMGVGANFQQKLYAAHHLDPARNMTPDQMEQRNGRILRDGNENSEVRVIYYGMEDTVTPAIWGRLQRKAAFIRQGLAAKGVGLEFEDTSEVRLEEMKSALISDKRQMKRAELLAEIKEHKVQREVMESRARSLRSNLASTEHYIESLERQMPQHQARAAKFETAVVPPFAMLDAWSFKIDHLKSNVLVPFDGADEKTLKAIEKAKKMLVETAGAMTADHTSVMRQLDKLVDALKLLPLGQSDLVRDFGTVRINGLPIRLTKEQVKLASTGEDAVCLVATVYDLADENRRDTETTPARFGSAEALFKLTQATYEKATMEPRSIARALKQARADREEALKLVSGVQKYDEGRLTQLQAELAQLEKDMREKPFIRGSARAQRKDQAVNREQASADGATAMPGILRKPATPPNVGRRHARI